MAINYLPQKPKLAKRKKIGGIIVSKKKTRAFKLNLFTNSRVTVLLKLRRKELNSETQIKNDDKNVNMKKNYTKLNYSKLKK